MQAEVAVALKLEIRGQRSNNRLSRQVSECSSKTKQKLLVQAKAQTELGLLRQASIHTHDLVVGFI